MADAERPEASIKDDVIAMWRVAIPGSAAFWVVHVLAGPYIPFEDSFARRVAGDAIAYVVGMPIGLAVGLAWYWLALRRVRTIPAVVMGGMFLMSMAMAAFSWHVALWRERDFDAEAQRREQLAALPADSIDRIVVYDRYMDHRLLTIDDREAIAGFAEACGDLEYYRPNHPNYTDNWTLVLETDAGQIDLDCCFEKRRPDAVVVAFTDAEPGHYRYYGTALSHSLRPWFEEHVATPTAGES